MPAAIDDTQQIAISGQLTAQGVPSALHASIYAAIDNAGFTVVDKTSGSSATLLAGSTLEVYTIDQRPGWKLLGLKLKTGLYLAWLEGPDDGGGTLRMQPQLVNVGASSTLVS